MFRVSSSRLSLYCASIHNLFSSQNLSTESSVDVFSLFFSFLLYINKLPISNSIAVSVKSENIHDIKIYRLS